MIVAIVTVILVALVTVFSVQNAAPAVLSFLFWKFEASLAIVIFLSVFSGVIIGAVTASWIRWRTSRKSDSAVMRAPK